MNGFPRYLERCISKEIYLGLSPSMRKLTALYFKETDSDEIITVGNNSSKQSFITYHIPGNI
jgi:hypothetical protein